MFASSPPRPPFPVLWPILLAYALLALQIAFFSFIFEKPQDCSAVSRTVIVTRILVMAINLALIAYVSAYGRWKILWLAPQVIMLVLTAMIIAFEPSSLPMSSGGICWVAY